MRAPSAVDRYYHSNNRLDAFTLFCNDLNSSLRFDSWRTGKLIADEQPITWYVRRVQMRWKDFCETTFKYVRSLEIFFFIIGSL